MSPGYDRPDHQGFLRRADAGCLFCHNAYPAIEPGSDFPEQKMAYPETMPEGIDCQRCHGPGGAHIEAVSTGDVEKIRAAIVNPARLSEERRLEVCLQCHLETTTSSLPHSLIRRGRGFFSYQPGEPLADYMLHFDYANGSGRGDHFEIAHAAYRLRKSACFQAGRMTCTTCHDPHHARRDDEAREAYIAACRSCHEADLGRLAADGRHGATSNCLDCHMPKRRAEDAVHVVMTDHYIQRRKPARDLLAPRKEVHETPANKYRGEVAL
jgi:predicted CXXCH cytochrome family protein